jgi:hypothetical protein
MQKILQKMRTTSGFTAQKPDLLYGTVPVIVFDANQALHQVLYRFRDFALLNISISVINRVGTCGGDDHKG